MHREIHRGRIHKRLIYKEDTGTHAQGTDPKVALGGLRGAPWNDSQRDNSQTVNIQKTHTHRELI